MFIIYSVKVTKIHLIHVNNNLPTMALKNGFTTLNKNVIKIFQLMFGVNQGSIISTLV